ncbi:MAG: hypothetical protein E3K37_15950 [Candidatus Kuenenia sp.]|nr:hypothetical protein [Candidatus Kuenenia hertensis]
MKKYFFLFAITFCLPVFSCTNKDYRVFDSFKNYEGANAFATELLKTDFVIQERVLKILEKALMLLEEDDVLVHKETFEEIIEMMNYFFDTCHFEKENVILFPFVKNVQGGMEKKDFLGQLLMEHISVRDRMRTLSGAVEEIHLGKKARKRIRKIGYGYIKFVQKHIKMEEKILFPWLNELLSHDDQLVLIERLKAVEDRDISDGLHEKYSIMMEKLENQLAVYSK